MSDGQVRDPYPLVHNKVLSPHFINPTLRRGRLIDWLNQHADCRAIVVAADAGYGKTTLLWQWEREVAFDCYWYKLDRSDRDWSLQISYLIEAVRDRHEGFGMRTVSLLGQIGAASAHGRATVTASLIAELNERIVEPATFIVDDWQFVASVTEVRGFWNQVLRDSSNKCRFVFLARAKPQLQFARFAAHGGYAELRTDALRFTEAEIGQLFGEVYQDPLAPEELIEVERRTEGWAASLQLIEVSLRERTTPDERRAFIESITATRDSDLFNFLAEEVLDQQPEQTRNFLLFTSILTQITPELAERMTGVHEGRKLLNELEHRGIFTFRLDPETMRYRYHGLFRDFLERCLKQERTDAEVAGLHIHAASYFETHAQWPDAIHHYLAAGLTTQAARLIARYGEEVVAGGRLGLIDEWLAQIPPEIVRANARLSLLWGEALGMRGEWKPALATLDRARKFFHRKGDARMEALACVKVSTVQLAFGDLIRGAKTASEGLSLASPDDHITVLRLRGNLAVSQDWMDGRLDAVERTCAEIARETLARGLDHYAAIAQSNIGILKRWRGDFEGSLEMLERAWSFWKQLDRSPYSDNSELVASLLALDRVDAATNRADEGIRATRDWPRPSAQAAYGRALVDAHLGDFARCIRRLEEAIQRPTNLGVVADEISALLIEAMYLSDSKPPLIKNAVAPVRESPRDIRQEPTNLPAAAILRHAEGGCMCRTAERRLAHWGKSGAEWPLAVGLLKLAVLKLELHSKREFSALCEAIDRVQAFGTLKSLKFWTRRLVPWAEDVAAQPSGARILTALLHADPDHWRVPLASMVDSFEAVDRGPLLQAIGRYGNRAVIDALAGATSDDAQSLRRNLTFRHAARAYVRTLGRLEIHKSSWNGPPIRLERPRSRTLLGLLVAHSDAALTRDQVLDHLWPDSSQSAATNSLNQAVYQLRRLFSPEYRDGEAPAYITSTAEVVTIDPNLVTTDIEEFRRLVAKAADAADVHQWQKSVTRAIELVRGEFLSELRYEDWVVDVQTGVHSEIRQALLPIAKGKGRYVIDDVAIRAATALLSLDNFDEEAYIAIAERLASSGRRVAARQLITRYASRLRDELEGDPSPELMSALAGLGVQSSVI